MPLSNESLSNIVAGITNGSIQLGGTDVERRDSVLKYLNEQPQKQLQQFGRSSKGAGARTKLREDIFEKVNDPKVTFADNIIPNATSYGKAPIKQGSTVDPVSPSSSLSSKASNSKPFTKGEDPQSPKTSPSGFNVRMKPLDLKQQQKTFQDASSQYMENGGYVPVNYAYQQKFQQAPPQSQPLTLQPSQHPNLVPAQQFVQAEDGRPLLGATKIDQLMLVIQARDNGINTTIPQSADGSILANPETVVEQSRMQKPVIGVIPQPIGLVGGIDKPGKLHRSSADDEGQGSNKRRSKDHQCPYCFKYFTQSTHLDVHVRSHIGYKPFECSYCHKRFTQGGNLRTHLRLHTGEKPFTCEECNRSFSRKGNLAAHLLTHKNEKPYECRLDNCDKAFTQLGNLKSHQNRFHLDTLNALTHRLAELTGNQLNNLPAGEKDLLEYFKDLYKNSNKGIRGRGKRNNQLHEEEQEEYQPQLGGVRRQELQLQQQPQQQPPPSHLQPQSQPQQQQLQQQPALYVYDMGYKR